MSRPWDKTPEDAWRIVADMAQFFVDRDVTQGPDVAMMFCLFVEMHCTQFPEDRIAMPETMMKMLQGVMTEHKGAN